jgi:hypothetical protein
MLEVGLSGIIGWTNHSSVVGGQSVFGQLMAFNLYSKTLLLSLGGCLEKFSVFDSLRICMNAYLGRKTSL